MTVRKKAMIKENHTMSYSIRKLALKWYQARSPICKRRHMQKKSSNTSRLRWSHNSTGRLITSNVNNNFQQTSIFSHEICTKSKKAECLQADKHTEYSAVVSSHAIPTGTVGLCSTTRSQPKLHNFLLLANRLRMWGAFKVVTAPCVAAVADSSRKTEMCPREVGTGRQSGLTRARRAARPIRARRSSRHDTPSSPLFPPLPLPMAPVPCRTAPCFSEGVLKKHAYLRFGGKL